MASSSSTRGLTAARDMPCRRPCSVSRLAPRLKVVEAGLLQRDADAAPHLGGLALHVEAADEGAALGGPQQRR